MTLREEISQLFYNVRHRDTTREWGQKHPDDYADIVLSMIEKRIDLIWSSKEGCNHLYDEIKEMLKQ